MVLFDGLCADGGGKMLKKILVVEDEPASLECLSHFLRKEGYRVSEARDGAEAIELLDKHDLILCLPTFACPASTVWLLRCIYFPGYQPFLSSR